MTPTRNNVEPTTSVTDELRRLLDERGVEWDYGITGATTTRFNANGVDLTFTPMRDGLVCSTILTPEQAIAATLGDVPSLPHFWTHDGTLHIELPKLPESISVRLPDQRDREVSSARAWCYTLADADAGTCHVESFDDGVDEALDGEWVSYQPPTWYLSCGHEIEGINCPNYCPECGRKVVDE